MLVAKSIVAIALLLATAGASPPPVTFRVYADTGLRLTGVLWTEHSFLYLENTTNTVWQAGPTGAQPTPFASMPAEVEETRCALSPAAHGFASGELYCHAPDNTIYRIAPNGSVTVFAHLPETATADGALAFDTVGRFGYALLAATGRSGGAEPAGGTVYAIGAAGSVRRVGEYAGPGGADEVTVAPARFGTGSGSLVLTVDAGASGTIVLMGASGATRTIASLPDGPNPIAAIPSAAPTRLRRTPPPGLYVSDTSSHDVFLAPASQLAPYAGDLIVGSETKGLFWIVRPRGRGFQTRRLPATLPGTSFNLEGATYVAG